MNSAEEWRDLIDALRALGRNDAREAALATIVRAEGPTFRRTGTHMLVFDDGQVLCELAGGSLQKDIVLHCLEAIDSTHPQRLSYGTRQGPGENLATELDGELDVLIEPLPATGVAFADALADGLDRRHGPWLATLFAADGQTLAPRHLVLCGSQVLHDGLDDPALADAIVTAVGPSDFAAPAVRRLAVGARRFEVLLETINPVHSLIVIGSDADARAVLKVAGALGWRLTLVDGDPQRLRHAPIPEGATTLCATPDRIRAELALDVYSSVLVMTHNLERDIAYLKALRDTPVVYIGAPASRDRARRMRDEAGYQGLRLHAPAGLDIGSEAPTETAMAIVTEILAVLHRRSNTQLHRIQHSFHG
ncbi:XdhC family protein [Dyella sp. C9]|uniref:XdhC family protein n=1 Tax=Dyella sp. C9 TaxID=2202154 RepID=UPI000DEF903D|nr:XdhC/CoxI family protein [Dyella sp. C9]